MAQDTAVIAQFLGDEEFPIKWKSEEEKSLLWVFDDLHCPQPLSPMYFDIAGWWLTCDHMFRRFGTPFATDWIAKNINGYLYTAAIPPTGSYPVEANEYGYRYVPRVPRHDSGYAERMGSYLNSVLPVYGEHFAEWWHERLVPEMKRNFAHLEEQIDAADNKSLAEMAVVLEDAIDVHDRHWRIHWMLNFAQLSATLNLRAVVQEVRGEADEGLLGRLQSSATDRNWDAMELLWRAKEEVKNDPALQAAFGRETGGDVLAALKQDDRGRAFLDGYIRPYQREFGWHAVWSHELAFPTRYERAEPVLELIRSYVDNDYDHPATLERVREDIASASEELLEGLEGEGRERVRAANEVNLKMAPLTPDHHFYIDQGANAHLRVVLIEIGKKLVGLQALDDPEDVIYLRYNELRGLMGDPQHVDVSETVSERRDERERAHEVRPRDWVGTATQEHLDFPYLHVWGFPEKLYREQPTATDEVHGLAASAGVVEGFARVINNVEDFDKVQEGDILVCQMTNPAWVVLFTKIHGLVTDAGGMASHPAVLAREFGIPAVIGTSVATTRIRSGDRVRVNGSTGTVLKLDEDAPELQTEERSDLFTPGTS